MDVFSGGDFLGNTSLLPSMNITRPGRTTCLLLREAVKGPITLWKPSIREALTAGQRAEQEFHGLGVPELPLHLRDSRPPQLSLHTAERAAAISTGQKQSSLLPEVWMSSSLGLTPHKQATAS